ncbi:MAG: L-threonylcarbamoyladenylate synthase [Anaerolineae bacterium]
MSLNTRVLKINPTAPESAIIQQAADILRAGGLVAFPTETVYGLGANALDAAALERIFAAKQRPTTDPIIAHIHDWSQLDQLAVEIPPLTFTLIDTFWPGPLTLILKRAPGIPANIAAGRDTIAVRMPAHPVARALIAAAGVPVAAPSANTFTRPSATTAAHVIEDLNGRIDLVLDGGAALIGMESTVLDLLQTPPVVLRPGGVSLEALRQVVPDVRLAPGYLKDSEAASAPGQMLKHYAPRARVIVFTGTAHEAVLAAMQQYAQAQQNAGQRVGVMVVLDEGRYFPAPTVTVWLGGNMADISRRFFVALRALDHSEVNVILVRDFGREGLGAALWDRMLRAAEGEIIPVG